jgi:hypothetical protein
MDSGREAPVALKVVAGLFVFGGICAVIEVIVALFHSRLNINFGVLGLFIGPGLLRFSRGWRTCALVFIWIGMVIMPVFVLLLLARFRPLDFNVFGVKVGEVPPVVALVTAPLFFLLMLWEYRVLTRPDVRRLFGLPEF